MIQNRNPPALPPRPRWRQAYEWVAEKLPPELAARCDERFLPRLRQSFGGPFNGQEQRRAIFRQVAQAIDFQVIIETGTFRGTTTEFMRKTSHLPVWTVEAKERFYHYSCRRFRDDAGVHLAMGDSRSFLERLGRDTSIPHDRAFFYLDAHWHEDIPLRDEVRIIWRYWREPVVMIDDFEVPDDPGYSFDDYGDDKRLGLEYLQLGEHPDTADTRWFWPRARAADESGARRGCVVLARPGVTTERLSQLSGLRSAHAADVQ